MTDEINTGNNDIEKIVKKKEEIIKASDINSFLFCPHSYYLDGIIKESNLPLSGFMAKTFMFKTAARRLIPEERYVGRELLNIEDIKGEELSKYLTFKSPEKFANSVFENWRRHVIEEKGQIHNRDIVWAFPNHWYKAAHELKKQCRNYYKYLLENGLPILDWTDKEAAFYFQEKKYAARLDFVERNMRIGEHSAQKPTKKELNNDWLITLKVLAYCTLAHDIEAYRMKLGIDEELAESWGGNKVHIDPDVKYFYHNLSSHEIYETTRCDNDIDAMLKTIEDTQKRIINKEYMPNHKNCQVCKYNVVDNYNEPVCKKKNPKVETLKPVYMFVQQE